MEPCRTADVATGAYETFDLSGNIAGLIADGRMSRSAADGDAAGAIDMSSYEAPVSVTIGERRGFWFGFGVFLKTLASLALRVALAIPFFKMGLGRWEKSLILRQETLDLYRSADYALKPCDVLPCVKMGLPERTYALPYPEIIAHAMSFAEIILPAALIIGFATRLSALGLLVMTALVFLINPLNWNEQLPWAAMALALVAYGPGRISFDHAIWKGFRRR